MELIKNEIEKIVTHIEKQTKTRISDEAAFTFLVIQYFYFDGSPIEETYNMIKKMITDGSNDGGLDFVYYDDENYKVILGQTKYTEGFDYPQLINELNKMEKTRIDFDDENTSAYNPKVRKILQDAIDRLPENEEGTFEYAIFSLSNMDDDQVDKKINSTKRTYSTENVNVYQLKSISSQIKKAFEKINLVLSAKLKFDKAENYLEYNNHEGVDGLLINVSSKSIINLYAKYAEEGLFDLNIRRYIRSKQVDDGIKKSLKEARKDFWFLNNGITIACESFEVDGNEVKIKNFSIVNGGQTTYLIGNDKESSDEFFLPCKIISSNSEVDDTFYNRIAEATNSQKPIQLRDLRSNSPEMKLLKKMLLDNKIQMEIKRGEAKIKQAVKFIKNDVLGQLILSFVNQKPGTARSNKKAIFENPNIYRSVFRVDYIKTLENKNFILDLIKLDTDVSSILMSLVSQEDLGELESEIIGNGKLIIFALLGQFYMIANEYLKVSEIINTPDILENAPKYFKYHTIISHYKEDDYIEKLSSLIKTVVILLADSYQRSNGDGKVTSVSNYFKLDSKYYREISKNILNSYRLPSGQDLRDGALIFKNNG